MDQVTFTYAKERWLALNRSNSEDDARREKGEPCLSKEDRAKKEREWHDLRDRWSAWEIGEEIRQRRMWMEAAEDWAKQRIEQRWLNPDTQGFDIQELAVDPDGETKKLLALLAKSQKAKLPVGEITELLRHQEHARQWLPVYYEYVRQSPRWLAWARMYHTRRCKGDPIENEDDPIETTTLRRTGREELSSTLGAGWVDALGFLTEYLGQDLPFSAVPMKRRQSIARTAASACRTHVEIDPDSWAIVDAGRPTCPTEAKWANREFLRIAKIQESVTTRHFGSYDARTTEITRHEVRDALCATVDESFILPHEGQWIPGESKIKHRTNDDLTARRIDSKGEESIVLRVNWNTTSNAEIGDAMAALCARIRPTKWPEFVEKGGGQEQAADKVLRLLLYWRMTASIEAPITSSLAEREAKQRMKAMRNALGRAVRDKCEAEDWFFKITGDTEKPWWSVTNRK